MNYLIGIALGLWLVVFPAAVLLLLRVDRSHDRVWEVERPDWADDPAPVDEADDLIYQQMCFERWEAEL